MHFVTKAPPINTIDSKCCTKKLKSSRTFLIGYLGFISCEWFLIAWRADTHTDTHTYRRPHDINFKKPGARTNQSQILYHLRNS